MKVNRHFRGTCCRHLQGQIISPTRNQHESKVSLLAAHFHAGFLLGLSFDHDNGGDSSPEMSVDFQWTTCCYIPQDRTLHNHCCENLKSYKNCLLYKINYLAITFNKLLSSTGTLHTSYVAELFKFKMEESYLIAQTTHLSMKTQKLSM
jgi:hypothetical protein